jgi:hypothetical protein
LLVEFHKSNPGHPFVQLRDLLWGKGNEWRARLVHDLTVEYDDPDDLEAGDSSNKTAHFRFMETSALQDFQSHQKILIRPEYDAAIRAITEHHELFPVGAGIIITGQPGIGAQLILDRMFLIV